MQIPTRAKNPLTGTVKGFQLVQKGQCPFWTKEISLRTARPNGLLSPFGHTLSAQSIFRDVHAAAKNELDLIRGLRAANSARLLGNPKKSLDRAGQGIFQLLQALLLQALLAYRYLRMPSVATEASAVRVTVNFTVLASLNLSSQHRNFSTAVKSSLCTILQRLST